MNPPGADPSTIRENLARAEQRRDAALVELAAATRELAWWREGLAMFDPEAAAAEVAEELADAEILQIVPDGYARNPTTRQIVIQAIRAEPAGEWPIARIFDLAVMHGWLAAEDKEQIKRITDMTALMAREGVLTRAGRGVYRLREDLIGALSRTLHPITDYRTAGRYRLPVPPRPALRPRGVGRRATSSDIKTSQTRE